MKDKRFHKQGIPCLRYYGLGLVLGYEGADGLSRKLAPAVAATDHAQGTIFSWAIVQVQTHRHHAAQHRGGRLYMLHTMLD